MRQDDPRAALARLVAASAGESLSSLSRLLGRNEAYLQQFVKRGSPRRLAETDRALLARYFGVDEAVLGGPGGAAPPARVAVPRLDARAAAGPGALNDGERPVDAIDFPPRLLRSLGVRGAASLIEAQGESMAPGIADGDLLLVDEGDRRVTARGGVFVLRVDGATLVKRAARRGGALVVTSDNPAAPPVDAAAAEIVGRVVWQSRAVR